MKKIAAMTLIGALLIIGACAVECTAETFRDRYTAEFAADQMDTEGSAEYMAYSAAQRKLEAAETAVWITVTLYGAGMGAWGLYKLFTNKE